MALIQTIICCTLMLTSILWLAMIVISQQQNTCTPKLLLENTLYDSVNLVSFNASSNESTSLYSYSFFDNMFTSPPKTLISLSQLQIDYFSEVNYVISSQIVNNSLILMLKTNNMSWTSAQVQFILHSRQDIYSQINLINVIQPNVQVAIEFTAKQVVGVNSSFIFINYILGVATNQSSNINFTVQPAVISNANYHIIAYSSAVTKFTVQTIYFDSSPSQFAYVYQQFWLTSPNNSNYQTIWAEFAPVIYQLIGFSTINFLGNSIMINSTFNQADNLMQVNLSKSVFQIKVIYFGIGSLPGAVCYPCDSYSSIDGCLPVCPNNSYGQAFSNGGKICRKCQFELGQTLNSSGNGCTCPNSQTYYQGNCYNPALLPPVCSIDSLLISNQCIPKNILNTSIVCPDLHSYADFSLKQCVCYQGYQLLNGSCVTICPVNSQRNPGDGVCYCSAGYLMSSANACESVCPANSIYLIQLSQCQCNSNYQMNNGNCVQCSQTEVYTASTGKCIAVGSTEPANSSVVCQPNQIIVKGICQCNQNSILSGGQCIACPLSTYKPTSDNQCLSCSFYCQTCTSATNCSHCQSGFNIIAYFCQQICGDGRKFVLPCDDGNNINGDGCSSTCQIEPGYQCSGGSPNTSDVCIYIGNPSQLLTISVTSYSPIYTSPGILTDFIINPPIQRSQSQIDGMFKYSFSNNMMRPNKIIITQSNKDLTSYRCFFSYRNALPNQPFTVRFDVSTGNSSATITLVFNTVANRVKSALHFMKDVIS